MTFTALSTPQLQSSAQSYLLQAAVEQAFNAVIITSASLVDDGPCISYCNPAFCSMTGYSVPELLGRSPRMLQGPLTDQSVIKRLLECLQSGQYFQGSTFNYRKNGTAYLVEWNVSPLRDPQGVIQAFVWVQQDITARVQAEQRQALLARALDATLDAVLIADHEAQILFVNQAFEQLTGYSSEEVVGTTPRFLQSGQHSPEFYLQMRETLDQGGSCQMTFTNRHKKGHLFYAAQTITPLRDETGATLHYVSVSKDVTEDVVSTRELREQAYQDPLTGLLNRRAGEHQLQACHRTAKDGGGGYAVILGDIDRFKQINDRFGHDVGDLVLKRCAALLSAAVRSGDAVVRWGGEEFLIVLPGCHLRIAQELADRIRIQLAQQDDAIVGCVTMSMGVGAWEPGSDTLALLRRTDQALYQAKQNGRNQVALAD